MINRRIGAFIAALRREQKLTQEQFAEKLGVSNRSVSRWETGSTLPDLAVMESICQITGVTLPELLSGSREDPSDKGKNHALSILALWDRETRARSRTLNTWFALGLITLLAAVLSGGFLSETQIRVLAALGVFFHALGFYHNSRGIGLSDAQRAILASPGGPAAMTQPEELLAFARRTQNTAAAQYRAAFRMICENLAEGEYVTFAMVGSEYCIGSAPGIWHCGVAVTQSRVILCGETVRGRLMTRTVMDVCARKEIRSVHCTPRAIQIRTAQTVLTIRGEDLRGPGEAFQKAVSPRK